MNKYIDKMTVADYETVIRLLKKFEPIENKEMKATGQTKDYVDLRFSIIKIQKIIKKYEKNV